MADSDTRLRKQSFAASANAQSRSPAITRPPANRTRNGSTPCAAASAAIIRLRMVSAAFTAAMALRSVPADAAVGAVLGTFWVDVAVIRTRSRPTPNSSATACATLTLRPCPISVPPWFTCTEPSVYTWTSAPAWLRWVSVNEMPNFTGVSAMPLFRIACSALRAAICLRRARYCDVFSSVSISGSATCSFSVMP